MNLSSKEVNFSGKEGDLPSGEGKSFRQKADDTLVARLFEDKPVLARRLMRW